MVNAADRAPTGGALHACIDAQGLRGVSIAVNQYQPLRVGAAGTAGARCYHCADEAIDPALLRSPFEYTRQTILRLINLSVAAARTGKWRGGRGRFSIPFMSRGARALAYFDRILPGTVDQAFACEVVPMSCSVQRIPKKQMEDSFNKIFEGPLPRGLEHIARRSKTEKTNFQRLLKRIPNRWVKCE